MDTMIIDVQTGEVIVRPLTEEEIALILQDQEKLKEKI
jgi:hypothetical protein